MSRGERRRLQTQSSGLATWARSWALTVASTSGRALPLAFSATFLKKSVIRSNGSTRPRCPFAVDLDVTGGVVGGAVEDAQRRGLEVGDGGDREDEAEGSVCAFSGRELLVDPSHGATEEEGELPIRAGES